MNADPVSWRIERTRAKLAREHLKSYDPREYVDDHLAVCRACGRELDVRTPTGLCACCWDSRYEWPYERR